MIIKRRIYSKHDDMTTHMTTVFMLCDANICNSNICNSNICMAQTLFPLIYNLNKYNVSSMTALARITGGCHGNADGDVVPFYNLVALLT